MNSVYMMIISDLKYETYYLRNNAFTYLNKDARWVSNNPKCSNIRNNLTL